MELYKQCKIAYDKNYGRYIKATKNMIAKSNDKIYALEKAFEFIDKRYQVFENNKTLYPLLDELDNNFRLGKQLSTILKSYRKKVENSKLTAFKNAKQKENLFPIENYTDKEIIIIFAEFYTYQELVFALEKNDIDTPEYDTLNNDFKLSTINDIPEEFESHNNEPKSREHTTSRQTLALHFMFKYMQVTNVDKTEVARFFQFLTGKSFDNIYKRVRDPYRENNKTLKSDLKYIREYFNKLEMFEIVKMINNEIAECDAKK